jgi:hypothetical protein
VHLSPADTPIPTLKRRTLAAILGWNRTSYLMLSAFLLLLLLMGYVWWPLAQEYLALIDWRGDWWRQVDWLLIGIFAVMSLLIMSRADLRADSLIVFVGFAGGLVIESWGTQTELWTYYTLERPPLWIIPAWPIASLSIDRLVRLLSHFTPRPARRRSAIAVRLLYWLTFAAFLIVMLAFVWPTLDKSFTVMALALCALLVLTPTDERLALLTFAAGSGLGYFLEVWGTTRLCWSYYTLETPPFFAVLAHGMAAVAFWRATLLLRRVRLRGAAPELAST